MKVHFIAIGGSAMHNLAIALKRQGHTVTGSDDEIFEPSKSRLEAEGILPRDIGWNPDNITEDLTVVILGMHAHADNPELLRALELDVPIVSYPEYIYKATSDVTRAVIGGSHGKTTITSMILHVLRAVERPTAYMVGAKLDGFDCMVDFPNNARVAVLEGDEYLSSPIDRRPKFHLYYPDIALISGIAWDHMNVFPTFENYVDQFRGFIKKITPCGYLAYCEEDPVVKQICEEAPDHLVKMPYRTHKHEIVDGKTYLISDLGKHPIQVFGNHNLQNISGAKEVCMTLRVDEAAFYEAMSTFEGASLRLEELNRSDERVAYRDFAHSPSKLKATTDAVKHQFPERKLVACMELHTYSSLNKEFLDQYEGAMHAADEAILYYSPEVVAHKRLPAISPEEVKAAFARPDLQVYTKGIDVRERLKEIQPDGGNLLLMTSGNLGGMDMQEVARNWVNGYL